MKKNIVLIIIAAIVIAAIIAAVCCLRPTRPADRPTIGELPSSSTNHTEPTSPTETAQLGDPYDEENNFMAEETFQYTEENLPNGYRKKDFDGDGLNNIDEIANGTDMYKFDTDGDGIGDHDEIHKTKTDPLKWSTRDDGKSDLEYWLTREDGFKAGWSKEDVSGFVVYINKPKDRLWLIRKVETKTFDHLETISEAYQISNYSGTVALNLSKYIDEVGKSIRVYKINQSGNAVMSEYSFEQKFLMFPVNDGDIFVLVYSGN